jgi:beta-phosphoglucomutase-like phosphatase (HAD superfamily)
LSLSAHDCYVIEDSRNGLLAAAGAGLPVAIVRSEFFADESFEGAAVVVDELTELVV